MQSENNNYPLKENDYVKLDDNQKKILEIIGNYYNCQTIKNTVMYKFRETTEGNLYEFLNSNFYNDKKISNSESINRIIEILIEFYNNNWRDWFQNSYNEHIIDIKDIIKEMFIEKYLLKINDNKFKENDLSDLISKFFYPYFTKNLNKIKYSEIDFIFYSKIKDIYPAVIDAITPQSKPDAIDVNPARTAGIISNEEPAADSKTASEPIKEKINQQIEIDFKNLKITYFDTNTNQNKTIDMPYKKMTKQYNFFYDIMNNNEIPITKNSKSLFQEVKNKLPNAIKNIFLKTMSQDKWYFLPDIHFYFKVIKPKSNITKEEFKKNIDDLFSSSENFKEKLLNFKKIKMTNGEYFNEIYSKINFIKLMEYHINYDGKKNDNEYINYLIENYFKPLISKILNNQKKILKKELTNQEMEY